MSQNRKNKNANNKNKAVNNVDSVELSYEEFLKFIEKTEKPKNAKEELEDFNIYKEYKFLEDKLDCSEGNNGIHKLCKYLITCVENDPDNGDYYSEENKSLIVEAGKHLYKHDGETMMYDTLMAWVPKRYRNEIAYMWNGIGKWEN